MLTQDTRVIRDLSVQRLNTFDSQYQYCFIFTGRTKLNFPNTRGALILKNALAKQVKISLSLSASEALIELSEMLSK